MKNSAATIRDIAKLAGVSTATVSRVLSKRAAVSDKTRRKVMEAVAQAKFKPNAIARSFGSQQSQMLALVLPALTNPYYAALCEGANDAASERGYTVSLFRQKQGYSITQGDADVMMSRRFDGVILTHNRGATVDEAEERAILSELQSYMNVVVIDAISPDYPFPVIFPDVRLCTIMAVRYLAGLGHSRIALIGDLDGADAAFGREKGYRAALDEIGAPFSERLRIKCTCDARNGESAAFSLLLNTRREEWPTAIVAANDLVALGVMHALALQGLRVPEDVSVIGCDNQFYAAYAYPTLTSIDMHVRDIGYHAVEMLLDPNTPPYQPRYEIVERNSCRAIR